MHGQEQLQDQSHERDHGLAQEQELKQQQENVQERNTKKTE